VARTLTVILAASGGTASADGGDATFGPVLASTAVIGAGRGSNTIRAVRPATQTVLFRAPQSQIIYGLTPSVDLTLDASAGTATAAGGDASLSIASSGSLPAQCSLVALRVSSGPRDGGSSTGRHSPGRGFTRRRKRPRAFSDRGWRHVEPDVHLRRVGRDGYRGWRDRHGIRDGWPDSHGRHRHSSGRHRHPRVYLAGRYGHSGRFRGNGRVHGRRGRYGRFSVRSGRHGQSRVHLDRSGGDGHGYGRDGHRLDHQWPHRAGRNRTAAGGTDALAFTFTAATGTAAGTGGTVTVSSTTGLLAANGTATARAGRSHHASRTRAPPAPPQQPAGPSIASTRPPRQRDSLRARASR
jgi:hypothetical protein